VGKTSVEAIDITSVYVDKSRDSNHIEFDGFTVVYRSVRNTTKRDRLAVICPSRDHFPGIRKKAVV
jgi:hypothetical protein